MGAIPTRFWAALPSFPAHADRRLAAASNAVPTAGTVHRIRNVPPPSAFAFGLDQYPVWIAGLGITPERPEIDHPLNFVRIAVGHLAFAVARDVDLLGHEADRHHCVAALHLGGIDVRSLEADQRRIRLLALFVARTNRRFEAAECLVVEK